ncbi:hypothetical protein C8B47_21430, partial [filamentous cyanobacterium CCP4]
MSPPEFGFVKVLVAVAWGGAIATLSGFPPAAAQVVPDDTLGSEASRLSPSLLTPAGVVDLIEGGALRSNSLFHSFADFNVAPGQRLYFANPATVENIVGRVTGSSASLIDGTLGVLGNANLFLINPNGLVFGPGAELDIRGAFTASTAEQVAFANGYTFGVVDATAPPLLTLGAPLGLASWLPNAGSITSLGGNLSAGQDVALAARTVDVQGRVGAGGDLSLVASDRLTVTDTPTAPTQLTAAGTLLLQGDRSLQIDLLNHPASRVAAGADLTLRSAQPVLTDAVFAVGGNFAAERLDGSPGSAMSPKDPVFEVAGDFALGDFAGGSLQILAGGSVTIAGEVQIDAPGAIFNDSEVALSNGQSVVLAGTTVPTLDVRAGTTGFFGVPAAGLPTSADIFIGSIVVPGGTVLLTNQFAPNPALAGDIAVGSIVTSDPGGGGSVAIDSRGGIAFEFIDVSGGDAFTFDLTGAAGDITLLAAGDILVPFISPFPATILSYGTTGGSITLASQTAVMLEDGPFGTDPFELTYIESLSLGDQPGGDILIQAPQVFVGGNVLTTTLGDGTGGSIRIEGTTVAARQASIIAGTLGAAPSGSVAVVAENLALDFTFLGTFTESEFGANAGNVGIVANQLNQLTAVRGAQITSEATNFSGLPVSGNAGNVTVTARDILLSGFQPGELSNGGFAPSAITSTAQADTEGNSGSVTINTATLTLREGAVVGTSSFGVGDSGQVNVRATESITIDGAVFTEFDNDTHPSSITSEIFTGAVGNGGQVNVSTAVLNVTNGGTLSTATNGDGSAGDVVITATDRASFDGLVSFAAVGLSDRVSSGSVETLELANGDGGTLTLTTPNLQLTNGARLEATTRGVGQAGSIVLNVVNDLTLSGDGTAIVANTTLGSTGDGGNILIDPIRVAILDGAQVSVASAGSGQAGNIVIEGGSLRLDRGLISAETLSSAGGNITLNINDVIVLLNNSRITTTAGTALAGGDGGNIDLTTTYLVAASNSNSDITANAFLGAGGSVLITAQGIFGLTPRSRAELESLLGTSDPALLDPTRLPTSDITAISRGNPNLQGQVIIQSPDVDPSQGTVPLPDNVVDASRLIAQGCSSGGTVAQEIGSLVVTGRGGLPPSPTDSLGSRQVLVDWATGEVVEAPSAAAATT